MRTLVIFLVLCPLGCLVRPDPKVDPPRETLDELLTLMNQRLALAEAVAQYKWVNKRPIEDPEREADLLGEIESLAGKVGVNATRARHFFQAQIDASKIVQKNHFKRWETGGPQTAADLSEVRAQFDRLNGQILEALKRHEQAKEFFANAGKRRKLEDIRQRGEAILRAPGVDEGVREVAMFPLMTSGK